MSAASAMALEMLQNVPLASASNEACPNWNSSDTSPQSKYSTMSDVMFAADALHRSGDVLSKIGSILLILL